MAANGKAQAVPDPELLRAMDAATRPTILTFRADS